MAYRSTLSFAGCLPYCVSFHSFVLWVVTLLWIVALFSFSGWFIRCHSSLSLFALFCLFSPLVVFILCSFVSLAFKLLSYWRWFRFLLFSACSFYNDVIFIWILYPFLQWFRRILYPFHQRLFQVISLCLIYHLLLFIFIVTIYLLLWFCNGLPNFELLYGL